jgi:thiol:disulfide interchange protein DsbA
MVDVKEGEQYTVLPEPIPTLPPVTVFFSFLDKTSYKWATSYKVVESIRRAVPAGTEVTRYHVSFDRYGWDSAATLTRAWAVALNLKYDDKVIVPLFEAIQRDKAVVDLEGIRELFFRLGIDKVEFDRVWVKDSVKKEVDWQNEVCKKVGLENVPPVVVVRGKYLLNSSTEGKETGDDADIGKQFAECVKGMLKL